MHDGRIVQFPIPAREVGTGIVYQQLVDNSVDSDMVLDYRVPVHGSRCPLVYLKYRPKARRFSNTNSRVAISSAEAEFSKDEIERILRFAREMGIDYGEFDVLRGKDDRLFIVDVNNTPWGPPNGLRD